MPHLKQSEAMDESTFPRLGIDKLLLECIGECDQCRNVCAATAAHFLRKNARSDKMGAVNDLENCAGICAACAASMVRKASLFGLVCGVCAQICEHCAEMCEGFGKDPIMQACAERCRECQKTCEKVRQREQGQTARGQHRT